MANCFGFNRSINVMILQWLDPSVTLQEGVPILMSFHVNSPTKANTNLSGKNFILSNRFCSTYFQMHNAEVVLCFLLWGCMVV